MATGTKDRLYDYIIVGGGSAGCVLANRLSSDPSVRVLLLEAGGQGRHPLIALPAGLQALAKSGRFDWPYETEAEPQLDGRVIDYRCGKVLGGSSAINGMIYCRGLPSDYDEWARRGNSGWSYRDVLPYFQQAESYRGGDNAYRGRDGPLKVTRAPLANPLDRAWLAAGEQAGYPVTDDFSGARPEGFGAADCTISDGLRSDTARCYLRDIAARRNLSIKTDVHALRIIVEKCRAVGIAYLQNNRENTIYAGSEVILSAGTIASPQLLLLSGIGPADDLRRLGIPVMANLPAVGKNLQDHCGAPLKMACTKPVSLYRHMTPLGILSAIAQYAFSRGGPLATSGVETMAFIRSCAEETAPDLQYQFIPILYGTSGKVLLQRHGFLVFFNVCRPESRGTVTLRSGDPLAFPKIEMNYLTADADRVRTRAALRIAREIFAQNSFDPYRGDELEPGPSVRSDREIDLYLSKAIETVQHPVGSCSMGKPDTAVVDDRLRVHGITGLRVADASIMPTLISGNTNAPTIMIAEKASDMIRVDATSTEAKQ